MTLDLSFSRDQLLLFCPNGERVKRSIGRRALRPLLSQVLKSGGLPAQVSWQKSGAVAGDAVRNCFDLQLAKPRKVSLRRYGVGGLVLQMELPVVNPAVYAEHFVATLKGISFPILIPDAETFLASVPQVFEAVGAGSPNSGLEEDMLLTAEDLPWLNLGDQLESEKFGLCIVERVDLATSQVCFLTIDGKRFTLADFEFSESGMKFSTHPNSGLAGGKCGRTSD